MKELIAIQSELKAPKNQTNTFGKYKYRSAEDILEALKPILKTHNCFIMLSDSINNIGDRYYIVATATIVNSEGIKVSVTGIAREEETKKGMDASQITGTASSYARKYALNGLFAIDDTKDADGLPPNEPKQPVNPPADNRKPLSLANLKGDVANKFFDWIEKAEAEAVNNKERFSIHGFVQKSYIVSADEMNEIVKLYTAHKALNKK